MHAFLLILTLLSSHVYAIVTVPQILGFLEQWAKDWSYPRVSDIANQITYAALTEDIVGRVDITNTFIGAELNTEYLFGMFAGFGSNENTSLIGVPLNQTVSQLIIQQNVAFTLNVINFNWSGQIIPLQFNTMWMFNDEGKVTQYDSQLVRSSWVLPNVLPEMLPRLAVELGEDISTVTPAYLVAKRAAIDICSAHESSCVGSLRQYASTADCIHFIMHKIPFGDIWQAGQNTGICRYLHKSMVSRRPAVHCPHIGPSGGDMCNDRTYTGVVLDDPFPEPFVKIPQGDVLRAIPEWEGGKAEVPMALRLLTSRMDESKGSI